MNGARMARRLARPAAVGFAVLGAAVWLAFVVIQRDRTAIDAHAYFVAHGPDLYTGQLGATDAYLYSPAFAQALEPLRWLGFDTFRDIWRLVEAGLIVSLAGPFSGALVIANPLALEVAAGNIHVMIAAAIVGGFRWPAAWAFVLLTKVTPGVGLLWFASRREWRSLGIAMGVTASIAAVSFAISPSAWFDWARTLQSSASGAVDPHAVVFDAPIVWRLLFAAAITVWAGIGNHRWAVPIAVLLAMPIVWITSLTVLLAVPALVVQGRRPRESKPPTARSSASVAGKASRASPVVQFRGSRQLLRPNRARPGSR